MHHIKFDGFFEVCMLAFARSPPFHSIFYLPSMKNSMISEICSYHPPFTILAEKYQFFCKRHLVFLAHVFLDLGIADQINLVDGNECLLFSRTY